MLKVTLREAKANLAKLIEKARSGEEVIITEKGKPLVKLTSVLETLKPKKRRIGGARGVIEFIADDFDVPLEDFKDCKKTE